MRVDSSSGGLDPDPRLFWNKHGRKVLELEGDIERDFVCWKTGLRALLTPLASIQTPLLRKSLLAKAGRSVGRP